MKAILEYGIFKAEITVSEPLLIISIPSPTMLSMYDTYESKPLNELTTGILEFRLTKSPQVGMPLEYLFIGDK